MPQPPCPRHPRGRIFREPHVCPRTLHESQSDGASHRVEPSATCYGPVAPSQCRSQMSSFLSAFRGGARFCYSTHFGPESRVFKAAPLTMELDAAVSAMTQPPSVAIPARSVAAAGRRSLPCVLCGVSTSNFRKHMKHVFCPSGMARLRSHHKCLRSQGDNAVPADDSLLRSNLAKWLQDNPHMTGPCTATGDFSPRAGRSTVSAGSVGASLSPRDRRGLAYGKFSHPPPEPPISSRMRRKVALLTFLATLPSSTLCQTVLNTPSGHTSRE